ncbi:hypothetical protein M9Y10_046081 [Tritrichomonas musculus]|uniref:Uncharacterized protein n=1 Tax=Tritrichomonas musculus TaxID=1915356 RepID=A0ABR2JYA0_9EUKA
MSSSEIDDFKKDIENLSKRGQELRKRELKVCDTVKYLLELIRKNQFNSYNQKIIDIIIKYQQLQARQRSLLESTLVAAKDRNEYIDHQARLQETLEKIAQFESEKEEIRENLESSFTVEELQNGRFLFSLKHHS